MTRQSLERWLLSALLLLAACHGPGENVTPLAPASGETAASTPSSAPSAAPGAASSAALPLPGSLSNEEVRRWYLQEVAKIEALDPQWRQAGLPARERARRAWKIRHDARLQARALMANRLEVEALRARDLLKYGNPDGPTFDYLVEQAKEKGLTGDAIYESIIHSAGETNREVNQRLGLEGPAPPAAATGETSP